MKLIKKPTIIIGFCLAAISTFSYADMTCSCSSGKMTVVHSGDTVTYTCSGGGRITCMMK